LFWASESILDHFNQGAAVYKLPVIKKAVCEPPLLVMKTHSGRAVFANTPDKLI
jgi:hypothetical protein